MDGGGRFLRSLGDFGGTLAPPPYAFAGPTSPFAPSQASPRLPSFRPRRRPFGLGGFERLARSRICGTVLALGLLGATSVYGAVRGGGYAEFVATQGTLPDLLARASGFAIKAVTIVGTRELSESEILRLAGIDSRNSLVFLDVADLRARLKAVPLIREASVSKLYPNRLLIEIEERQPYALWQKDGAVSIVADDGTPIDDMHDARFERLPLVVGDGANKKLPEYLGILDASGELRGRIRAGMYVSGRRWTLKTGNGIEIALPETSPAAAVARLARLEHDGHILEKDVLSLDLRVPGRVVARLTSDAAAAREASLAKKTKKKGVAT